MNFIHLIPMWCSSYVHDRYVCFFFADITMYRQIIFLHMFKIRQIDVTGNLPHLFFGERAVLVAHQNAFMSPQKGFKGCRYEVDTLKHRFIFNKM